MDPENRIAAAAGVAADGADGAGEAGEADDGAGTASAAEERYQRLHGQRAWDERYAAGGGQGGGHSHSQVWSGEANAALIDAVEGLEPGTAFDAGAGEGGDALWLVRRGWRVTAADVSPIALERGRAVAEREWLDIDWRHSDLTVDSAPAAYDLVTAMYLHIPAERRPALFAHLADAVAPGGTLVIVGHDPSDADTTVHRPDLADVGWRAEEAAQALPDGWSVDACAALPRTETDGDGREATVHDAVLRARRP